jgi:cytochrome P450
MVAAHPGGTDDLVNLLLTHPDFDSGRLTMAQVCDDVLAHLIASSESTATALAWSFLLIARNPAVEARLREEIVRTVGNRRPDIPDLNRMPYLRGVFAEALRLYPPTWSIMRASARAFELDGFRLPKGTCMLACQYAVHRDRLWFERPDDFIPERWLESTPARIPKFAYFPFGGGRRVCPGRRMGQITAYTIIARVLQQFHVHPGPDGEVKAAVDVTLHPVSGTVIQVTPIRTHMEV